MRNRLLLTLLIAICFSHSFGQKAFVEGELIYALKISRNNNTDSKQLIKGIYTLRLKGNSIQKEMTLENGFRSTLLYNGSAKTYYSFRKVGNQNFAIQLNGKQIEQTRNNCNKLNLEIYEGNIKTIKNFKTENGRITCNNSKPINIYFTREWTITNPYLFDEFAQFSFLPLAFEIINEDGSIFEFELTSIVEKPMDNNTFIVPKDFKIISQEDFKSWQH